MISVPSSVSIVVYFNNSDWVVFSFHLSLAHARVPIFKSSIMALILIWLNCDILRVAQIHSLGQSFSWYDQIYNMVIIQSRHQSGHHWKEGLKVHQARNLINV